jgi:hypothetical protein
MIYSRQTHHGVTWQSALFLYLGCAIVGLILNGCGGGHDNPGLMCNLLAACSGAGQVGSDQIGMQCSSSPQIMAGVRVMIGGPTTSSDIYGIKFDLVFDSTLLRFDGQAMEGSLLNKDGQSASLEARLAANDPGRLIVAITRLGSVGGVQANASEETVMTIGFSGLSCGTASLAFDKAMVVDSNLNPIPGIQFVGPLSIRVQ